MKRLVAERLRRGWSQAELARRARVHPSEISRCECGWLRATPYLRAKIVAALGVPEEEIFARNGDLLEEDSDD